MTTADEVRFAQRLAAFFASLTEDQVEAVVAGRAKLQVVAPGRRQKKKRGRTPTPGEAELQAVLEYLNDAPDRESGFAKLDQDIPSKAALEALARLADLPVLRRDTVQDLRQRIVEATIGYRLRSRAVQGREP